MKKIIILLIPLIITLNSKYINANPNNVQNWLNTEINKIIDLYRDENIDNITRLNAIEVAINKNFAGTGIARFVVGSVWKESSEGDQKEFIKQFKKHLYLTIGSLMQGYSNQTFTVIDSKEDKNQGVYLIDIEIEQNDQKTLVTWRVKESKNKFYVIDLIVADVSLVITKRAEFSSLLKKADNNLKKLNTLLEEQNLQSYNKLIN